jgi:hypothetical protein
MISESPRPEADFVFPRETEKSSLVIAIDAGVVRDQGEALERAKVLELENVDAGGRWRPRSPSARG